MLQAKYQSPMPYGFWQKYLISFLYISLCEIKWGPGRDKYWPWRRRNLNRLKEVQQRMLHIKYLSYRPYGYLTRRSLKFLFWVAMTTRILSGNYFSTKIKYHERIISVRFRFELETRYRRRFCFEELLTGGWWMIRITHSCT